MSGAPLTAEAAPGLAAGLVVALADALRRRDVEVTTTSVILASRALAAVGVALLGRARAALRATLVHSPEDRVAFDAAFAEIFGGPWSLEEPAPVETVSHVTLAIDSDETPPSAVGDAGDGEDELTLRYSRIEVLRQADLATLAEEELAEALALMDRLSIVTATRPSRRLRPTHRRRGAPDLKRTVRASLATHGEPLRQAFRRPAPRPRRLVLLVDVSGSMQPYARGLLRFAHSAVAGRAKVEVFAFATRLTRLTRELNSRDPQEALDRAASSIVDYASGTRLGECLATFCDTWGIPGMARGAIVVICSDGWDRGDPDLLAEQLQRLRRVTHRLVWVNPLKAAPGYAPVAQGMAAALPHLDEFVEGHSVETLERLAETLRA